MKRWKALAPRGFSDNVMQDRHIPKDFWFLAYTPMTLVGNKASNAKAKTDIDINYKLIYKASYLLLILDTSFLCLFYIQGDY